MFTGIVQLGKVEKISKSSKGYEIEVSSKLNIKSLKIGESIAIDGTCLSLTSKKNSRLRFFASPETLEKTMLSTYKKNTLVNIELPMKTGEFLGGHYVLGHVDAVSNVKKITLKDKVWILEIHLPKQFKQYVVYKGSIGVNGVSLTINKVKKASFELCIIPITLKKSNISSLKKGSPVNLEFDILAKYTERILKMKP
jgi:riboflavin synthase